MRKGRGWERTDDPGEPRDACEGGECGPGTLAQPPGELPSCLGWHYGPGFQGARKVGEWVGLRPHRPSPRVELELLPGSRLPVPAFRSLALLGQCNDNVQVIHNYGHGGNGFVLSWGAALEVAQLFRQAQLRAHI